MKRLLIHFSCNNYAMINRGLYYSNESIKRLKIQYVYGIYPVPLLAGFSFVHIRQKYIICNSVRKVPHCYPPQVEKEAKFKIETQPHFCTHCVT